jgi:glycosyltransferase involved in cell wall biosynthesis
VRTKLIRAASPMSNSSPIIAQCTEYSIRSFGGTEVLVAELIRRLSSHCKTVLVSNDDQQTIKDSEFSSLIVAHIPWRPENASSKTARNLAHELRAHHVDLAHFHFGGNYTWGSRMLNRCPLLDVHRAGIRCMSTNHGAFALLDGYCASWRPVWLKLALLPAAWLSKMQVVWNVEIEVAVSRHDLRNLRTWYWPLRGKFRQIYHSKIQNAEPVAATGLRQKTVLCVGTIGFRKGQPVLVEAFEKIAARYPDWNLVLAGRGAEPSLMAEIEMIRKRSHLEERIRHVEDLSDQAIVDLMRTSEIFALPSLLEGLGLSLQEALFHGCACVASNVGGIPELIDNGGNGLLVSPGNADELAAALERLISDQHLRRRLSARASSSILEKGMTAERMTEKYLRTYESIVG